MESSLSRRDFLKSTGKALGLASVLSLSGCITTPMMDVPRLPLNELSQIRYLGMDEQEKEYYQIRPRVLTSEQASLLRHYEILETFPRGIKEPLFSEQDIKTIKEKYPFVKNPSNPNTRDKVFLMKHYIQPQLGPSQYFSSKPISK